MDALEDELEDQEELADDEEAASPALPVDPVKLKAELDELRNFAKLARGITVNAKGEALIPALKTALERAEQLGAQRKAVIFTESRRTQQYLFDLLSARGYRDQLVMMNGSNSDPHSRAIYDQWLERHKGDEADSGSRTVDTSRRLSLSTSATMPPSSSPPRPPRRASTSNSPRWWSTMTYPGTRSASSNASAAAIVTARSTTWWSSIFSMSATKPISWFSAS